MHPGLEISTHTLTWSVTIAALGVAEVVEISTHTLTWSVTVSWCMRLGYFKNFNSHAHVERDHNVLEGTPIPAISTHTLTWSVTIDVYFYENLLTFQLTRSRGA